MTTKTYLRQVGRLNRMIQNKLREISQLREMAQSLSEIKIGDKVQSTPNQDSIGTAIAKIDEMERQVSDMIDELADKKTTIIKQIDGIDDEMQYEVLSSYYVEGLTFEEIATKIGYSFRHITRFHGSALQSFERKYGNLYCDL